MEFMECVRARRSIRGYRPDALGEDILAQLFEAVSLAPSGMNTQAYRFYCVLDEKKRAEISEKACHQEFIGTAPVIIAATCEKGRSFDTALAIENLVLAAAANGIGSCCIGWFDKEKVREVLSVPAEMEIPLLVTLGYAQAQPEQKERKGVRELFSLV